MRILCIGNNTEDTDRRTRELAQSDNVACHGLISELEQRLPVDFSVKDGYYHSSIVDLAYYRIIALARFFDKIIVLDQAKTEFSHPDEFLNTMRLANEISKHHLVEYQNPDNRKHIDFFSNLVVQNKSFCIFPFIELLAINGNTTVCCRSETKITSLVELQNYATDTNYKKIRSAMLNGTLLPDHCSQCYDLESKNIVSARIQETIEWSNRLKLSNLEDLSAIQDPVYYEIRSSNTCNLQCRTCDPNSSHLIATEYDQLGITKLESRQYTNFDFVNLNSAKKIYIAGGEPTAIPDFYNFLDRCVKEQKTHTEIVVNTNGTKINDKFKHALKNFTSFQFIVSIDGYNDLNHYIRWPSNWDAIIENCLYLLQQKHFVSFNVTVSIYNVWALDKLFAFFDKVFPSQLVNCTLAWSENDILSAFSFPNQDFVLQNLLSISKTNCYQNNPRLQSFIKGLIVHYQKNFCLNKQNLAAFFEFNDKLDQSRNIKLADYIPELEAARTLI